MPILYTHTDFDGLACAVLLGEVEDIVEIKFAEPEDIQKREIDLVKGSIVSDLPWHPNCGKWFDHHASTAAPKQFEGRFDPHAKSAARVVMDYYDNPFLRKKFSDFVNAADKIDTADFMPEDLKNPSGYFLISISLDAEKTASASFAYRRRLIELLRKKPLEKVLADGQVAKNIADRLEMQKKLEAELPTYTRVEKGVAIVDLRNAPAWMLNAGGRFAVYLQNPACIASMRVRKSKKSGIVDISIAENIFNRGMKADAGAIAKRFGGGGHHSAAGCSVDEDAADAAIEEIVGEIGN
ncbi:hypothetical protein HY095_00625 [Candidatus Micrarchaeota archaeon]|nr:hypothetical protein [Candidatus Micrarchaeota archaeon]